MMRVSLGLGVSLAALLLSGCGSIFSKDKTPIEGDRLSVFLNDADLKVDSALAASVVALEQAEKNQAWAMASGVASHAPAPAALSQALTKAWDKNIGLGGVGDDRLLNGPVIAEDKVFTVDARGVVMATSLASGETLWSVETLKEGAFSQPFGGGVAYEEGHLYVTTSGAEILCLESGTGQIIWRQTLAAPVRSSPTVSKGRVFVATISNQLDAFETKSGQHLWTNPGIVESAGLLGGASPAVEGDVVVVAYTSGEIYALNADNGFPFWSESLNLMSAVDSVSALAHIKARPVIANGLVFLISHGGRMSAIDLRTGQMAWTRDLGGIRSPTVSKGFLFMLTNENQLLCLEQKSGKVVWVKQLAEHKNFEKDGEKILWAGPILAGDALVMAGSNGKIIFCSPQGGEIVKVLDADRSILLSPIVAEETLLTLSQDAQLVAFR